MAKEPQKTDSRKTVVFRDGAMRTSYCNVVNVAATSEEFALLIGVGRSWHGKGDEFEVDLNGPCDHDAPYGKAPCRDADKRHRPARTALWHHRRLGTAADARDQYLRL